MKRGGVGFAKHGSTGAGAAFEQGTYGRRAS